MTKVWNAKKFTFFLAVLMAISCMAVVAYAASLTTVAIWHPETTQTPTAPYIVYMDDSANDVEKLAWKTLSSSQNPYFDAFNDHVWQTKRYVGNNDANALKYAYQFDAGQINQSLVQQQPYYLGIHSATSGNVMNVTMGCRTMFPMTMKVKIPTGWVNQAVAIAYVTGSCDGYVYHQADDWSDLMGSGGDPNYMNGFTSYLFTPPTGVTTDSAGYVTFFTHHGGNYTITKITQ